MKRTNASLLRTKPMQLLLVRATGEQSRLAAALVDRLGLAFPGEIHELDATHENASPRAMSETLAVAHELRNADAIVVLLPSQRETASFQSMRVWFDRAGVNGITIRREGSGTHGLLEEKPVFLLRRNDHTDCDAQLQVPEHCARKGLGQLGLADITVINVEPHPRGHASAIHLRN